MRWLVLVSGTLLGPAAGCGDGASGGSGDVVETVAADHCVAAGSGNKLNDNIADLTLVSCDGETVNLHASCDGDVEAVWLIATAGWCTSCLEFFDRFRVAHGVEVLTRAAVRAKTPGLDLLIILGEDHLAARPTQAYCKAFAEDLNVDPAMVLLDWSEAEVAIRPAGGRGPSIMTHALGATWTAVDPYLEPGVAASYPWWALLRARNMAYLWNREVDEPSFADVLSTLLGYEVEATLFE